LALTIYLSDVEPSDTLSADQLVDTFGLLAENGWWLIWCAGRLNLLRRQFHGTDIRLATGACVRLFNAGEADQAAILGLDGAREVVDSHLRKAF
jgi:hypothetical protein